MVLPTIPFQMSVFLSVNLKPFLRRIDLHLFPGWQFYGFNQFCKIIMASRHSGINSDKLRTVLTCKSPPPFVAFEGAEVLCPPVFVWVGK